MRFLLRGREGFAVSNRDTRSRELLQQLYLYRGKGKVWKVCLEFSLLTEIFDTELKRILFPDVRKREGVYLAGSIYPGRKREEGRFSLLS